MGNMAKKDNAFKDILGLIENDYASVVSDGTYSDVSGYIDTGSYTLNALLSGSIFKGLPNNKITAFAGEPATGKTYFALSILKHFLNSNPSGLGIIFESEGALDKQMLEQRGLDLKRILIVPVETVQQFKTQAIRIIENYLKKDETEKRPIFLMLDSLGMLSTTKEMGDSESGKEVKDMTRTQEIKAAFRVVTLKLSKAKLPLLVTNHVYQTMGMFPTKEMAGGGGLKYAASSIIALGKSKDKDSEGNLTGAIIRCKNSKGRLTREGAEATTLLSQKAGLDRYYGLVDLAVEHGIFKKVSTKIELPDGKAVFEKHITNNPEKYFTDEVLSLLDVAANKEYLYGISDAEDTVEELLNESDS